MITELWFLLTFTFIVKTIAKGLWGNLTMNVVAITWPQVTWSGLVEEGISVLCIFCPLAQDCWFLPVGREARTKVNKVLEACPFWISSFEGCVFRLRLPRNNTAAQNKVHTREGLSSTFLGFQQLVSVHANISESLQAWKMNRMLISW